MRAPLLVLAAIAASCSPQPPAPTMATTAPATSASATPRAADGAASATAQAPIASRTAAAPSATATAFVVPPEPPWPDDRKLLEAPASHDHLIIKVGYPYRAQFKNLRYEGHNGLLMKGAADGEEVAERWRALSAGLRGVFVLRDSMWSQQDHAYHRRPYALMMPPSWVTVAVAEVAAGRAIRPPAAPSIDDDDAWAAIATPNDMFGVFPASDSLHREATRRLRGAGDKERRQTAAARASLRSLAADVQAMVVAAPGGIEAVAAAGANRIADSDARYFGAALRYHRVIPIFVENPNTHELVDEGKGMTVKGRDIAARLVKLARDSVYRRRLRAGDLAIERYDLSVLAERDRAVEVLESLIPAKGAAAGGKLWLWVTGKLDPHRKAEGENATRYLPAFRKQLAGARIDPARLRLVSKPSTNLPTGTDRARVFRSDVRWYRHRDLPYAVRITTQQLRKLIQR